LDFVKNNLPKDSDFMKSPVGQTFLYDLEAIDGELHGNWAKLINYLIKEREIMFKNQSVEEASDIEIRLAEAYFKNYQETENLEHLNQAYNHLDLAKTIAIENQNYIDMCRLIMLKGFLATKSNLSNQARAYFEEALQLANDYNLLNIKREIVENLEQLKTGMIQKSANSILRRIFNRLTFRKTEEVKAKKKGAIYSIFIGTQDRAWELMLINEKKGNMNDASYLQGFLDLWKNVSKSQPHQTIYFTVSKGAVLIENSAHFQLFAFCDHLDYLTRLTIQNFLPDLENFSFRYIPEELEEKILKTLDKSIGKFAPVDLT